jgi:DNA invertase Pin-like site-specific DNA recombinase
MNRQLGKSAALYFRTATRETSGQHLDNQMQRLLCYARENAFDSFMLYADCGASGLTFDRPALGVLKADIKAGRIDKIIVYNLSRIGRDYASSSNFIEWALKRGVIVIGITDGYCSLPSTDGGGDVWIMGYRFSA